MSESAAIDIRALNEKIQQKSAFIDLLNLEIQKAIIGQEYMIERILLGLLSGGHVLLLGSEEVRMFRQITKLSKVWMVCLKENNLCALFVCVCAS